MNPLLSQLYRTDRTKVASEGGAETGEESQIDLSQISAAQLLAGLEDGTIVLDGDEPEGEQVKEAGEITPDMLQGMSARELLELMAAEEENQEKVAAEQQILQMQQDGSFGFFDTGGRILAHAFTDERTKIASAEGMGGELPDDIEVDLDTLSAEEFAALVDAGYDFVDDEGEKTAGMASAAAERLSAMGASVGRGASSARGAASSAFGKYRASVGRSARQTMAGGRILASAAKGRNAKMARRGAGKAARGAAGLAGKVGLPVAAAGGAAYGGARMSKKKK